MSVDLRVKQDLAKMLSDLDEATEELKRAVRAVEMARSNETSAINRVNDLQKKIDAEIQARREAAPRNTDWKREKVSAE